MDTLDRERMAVEVAFRTREPDGIEYLWWFAMKGVDGAGPDTSTHDIDADHEAQARLTKAPGWLEAEPQVVLLPQPVLDAVRAWAVRE